MDCVGKRRVINDFLSNTLSLYLDAAPWLLLGLLAAGLLKAWVPESLMSRWLGGEGFWPVTKAALAGAPLPLCSCGVLPAALGLRRAGASRGSTVSFLIATPETGVDSVAVTYALMGPFMAVVRPISAILSAIFTGLLAAFAPDRAAATVPATPSCSGGCCCTGPQDPPPSLGPGGRVMEGMRYAITDVLDDIALWLAIGLLVAGLIATAVPPLALAQWGSGLGAMVVMLLAGIPMYICATASTPFAAALLMAGVSPGTVLVFLLAGPATNIATIAILRRELGQRLVAFYLAGIALASIALGLATDAAVGHFGIDVPAQMSGVADVVPAWLAAASGVLLALLALKPLRRRLIG